MSKLRAYQATLSSPAASKLRVYQATLVGTAPLTPKLRVYQATLSGTAAVRVNPIAPVLAGPGETVSLTAALTAGGSADAWTWRRISGPVITFAGSGPNRSIVAPSVQPPNMGVLKIGVIATVGSDQSPEVEIIINLLPQTKWYYTGSVFAGSGVAPA